MNNTKAIAIRDDMGLQEIGNTLAKCGYFQDARDASQAIVKVLAGRELGFGPIASMMGVNIIKGRISLSANLMAAMVKRSGRYNYKIACLESDVCELVFTENGETVGTSRFTWDDVVAANLHRVWDKDSKQWKDSATYKGFTRNMLFARAMSNGVRWYCPDLTGGAIYTPDELGVEVDGETGEVLDVSATVVDPIHTEEPEQDATTFEQNVRDSCRARVAHASKALGLNKLLKRLLAQRTDADPAPMEILEQYAADIERIAQYVTEGQATAEQIRGLMEEAFIDGEDALGRALAVCEQCANDAAEAETQP